MRRRALVLSTVLFAAVMMVLAGCAQKPATEMESAEVQEQQAAQAETGQAAQEKQAEEEAAAAEEGDVEEYGVSGGEAEEAKEAEEGLTDEARQTLKKRVHFAFDSSELSKKAQDTLKSKAKILKRNSGLNMVIAGHCDERGTDEYNMALGERRARAAYEYLILLGVDADRMDLVSYGEERPIAEGHNEEAWAKNRRDEFKIKK